MFGLYSSSIYLFSPYVKETLDFQVNILIHIKYTMLYNETDTLFFTTWHQNLRDHYDAKKKLNMAVE